MAQGTTLVDFGAFPGASDAFVDVAQPSIGAGSLAEAWIFPAATADHTADEHMVETIKVFACDVQAGVGFRIRAFNTSEVFEPVPTQTLGRSSGGGQAPGRGRSHVGQASYVQGGGVGTSIYGLWNVGWVWN